MDIDETFKALKNGQIVRRAAWGSQVIGVQVHTHAGNGGKCFRWIMRRDVSSETGLSNTSRNGYYRFEYRHLVLSHEDANADDWRAVELSDFEG